MAKHVRIVSAAQTPLGSSGGSDLLCVGSVGMRKGVESLMLLNT